MKKKIEEEKSQHSPPPLPTFCVVEGGRNFVAEQTMGNQSGSFKSVINKPDCIMEKSLLPKHHRRETLR